MKKKEKNEVKKRDIADDKKLYEQVYNMFETINDLERKRAYVVLKGQDNIKLIHLFEELYYLYDMENIYGGFLTIKTAEIVFQVLKFKNIIDDEKFDFKEFTKKYPIEVEEVENAVLTFNFFVKCKNEELKFILRATEDCIAEEQYIFEITYDF